MTFRVTQFGIESQAIRFASRHNADIFRFQGQITSGLRFTRPSEAPLDFRRVTSLNNQFTQLESELQTIATAESTLNSSVSQLTSVRELLTSVSTTVQSAIQSTEPNDRNALAVEVEGILNQLQTVANFSFSGEFLYGGTKTDRPPFTFDAPAVDGRPISVNYNGSTNNGEVFIGDGVFVDSFYNGLQVFGGSERQPTVLAGRTSAALGSGTDTLTSRATLQITHDSSSFTGSSGIAPGTDSANDTILGNRQVTIVDTAGDGSSGTISIDGGPEFEFTNTDTNLAVLDGVGNRVFVDTTSITAGFNGTVELNSTGFLSVDDGATQIPIDFSSNQIVTDSVSGGFVTIDSSAITGVGEDFLDFPGTSNVFELLGNIIDNLRNTRDFSNTELAESLSRQLGELESVTDRVLVTIGSQLTSLRTLDVVGFRKESLSLSLQNEASSIQATDFSEAALQLGNAQSLLEFTFAVTSRITSLNVLDFLR